MERLLVTGGRPLKGTVNISGSKNAVLPILAATILANGKTMIEDVPDLADVNMILNVLERLGAKVDKNQHQVTINSEDISNPEAPYEYVRKMRASFLVMGPLLAKLGKAKISLPGGCAIGSRPIDLHLKGFAALGAEITCGYGVVEAEAKQLKGDRIYLDFPSVGATENIMMAAVLAEGTTVIENAAEEPEIVDLANYLNSMGAQIRGAGTNIIRIEGVKELIGSSYQVIPDRIEAGTFLVAGAMTRGELNLTNVLFDHLKPIVAKLQEAGAIIKETPEGLYVKGPDRLKAIDIKTLPYPGFPTDMQAQMMAGLAGAAGTSVISETVFENRFMHVSELKRMGASIKIDGQTAVIRGVDHLTAAPVKATDLRAGAALVLAGLVADGVTEIANIHHIDRGYENIVNKFQSLGAQIERSTH